MLCAIWYDLYIFKKREKHPCKSITFSKVAAFLINVTLLYWCFSSFLYCTNGTKLRKVSHVILPQFHWVKTTTSVAFLEKKNKNILHNIRH